MNSQSTPAAATPQEPNIQNVNPNVIHSSSSSTTASNISSHHVSSSPNSGNNKSQVITQNIHLKNTTSGIAASTTASSSSKDNESLVVSVPLSATSVPGIQLPTNSSNSNSPIVSTIVQMQTSPMSVSSSSIPPPTHGSLYQHLTNNQPGSQRASPLMQQSHQQGRSSSPNNIPTTNTLNLENSSSNHTSVLQNMNSGTGSVISSTGFHGSNVAGTTDTSPTMLKVHYEKQPQSRIHAIQQEESGRRSRYVQTIMFIH